MYCFYLGYSVCFEFQTAHDGFRVGFISYFSGHAVACGEGFLLASGADFALPVEGGDAGTGAESGGLLTEYALG